MSPETALLSVVLVSHNSREFLPDCLRSLADSLENMPHEIIVVDNASSDGTPQWVEESYPEVKLISNPSNAGYPQANNQGIELTSGEYVLFLNPDTVVGPGVFQELIKRLESDPELAAAAPALRLPSGRIQISFGGKVHVFREAGKKLFGNRFLSRCLERDKRPRKAAWLGGACLLCRSRALEAVQGFDERFFLYFEDIDLCYRLRDHGWRLCYLPELEIRHVGGGSTSAHGLQSRFYYRQSQIYFYGKHAGLFSRALLKLYLRLGFCGLYLQGLFRGTGDLGLRKRFFTLLRRS